MKLEHKDNFSQALEQLASSELEIMLAKIYDELERRERVEREQAWEEVKRAISQYIKKYGYIAISLEFGDEYYVSRLSNLEDTGTISIKL